MDVVIFKWMALMMILIATSLAPTRPEIAITDLGNDSRLPQEEWNKTFGGSSDDVGTFVSETSEGGYIIVGSTESFGADVPYSWLIRSHLRGDLWLIKTDSKGNLVWERTFGGFGREFGFSVEEAQDGGYIICGAKRSSWVGSYDLWILKTDSEGIMEWERTFGGEKEDLGFFIRQTKDLGYISTGYISYGVNRMLFIIKTDSDGNKEWEMGYGGENSAEGVSLQETSDGGYIITGYISSDDAGKEDVWLIKTDSNGFKEWDRTFGGTSRDIGLSVGVTEDGGYIITGLTESFGAGNGDVWLIKTDREGNKEWDRTFGGANFDQGSSVQQTMDGGYAILGFNTISNVSDSSDSWYYKPSSLSRIWLIKTDSQGNMEWDLAFGGSRNDWGNSGQQTQDGGYILTGVTESYGAGKSDVWLIRVG